MFRCHKCGTEWQNHGSGQPTRRDLCDQCHLPLHVCLNCVFFDLGRSKQCRLDEAELVSDKEKSNFCDLFKFTDTLTSNAGSSKTGASKAGWEGLFKKV